MSLFYFQQTIAYPVVRHYLHWWEPTLGLSPEDWATEQVQNLRIGDILFLLEPIYSPWEDCSPGWGVTEGDSFKVTLMCPIVKSEFGYLTSISLDYEWYKFQLLEPLLATRANLAKSGGTGFYYVVVRPIKPLSPEASAKLSKLSNYEPSGLRVTAETSLPDPVYAFFIALDILLEPTIAFQASDIGQLMQLIFSTKEPLSDSKFPDLQQFFNPVPTGAACYTTSPPTILESDIPPVPLYAAPAQDNALVPIDQGPTTLLSDNVSNDALSMLQELPHTAENTTDPIYKLDLQIAKASQKLTQYLEELQNRLTAELSQLLTKSAQTESVNTQQVLELKQTLLSSLGKSEHNITSKIIESSNAGRDGLKQFTKAGCESLDAKHQSLLTSLKETLKGIKEEAHKTTGVWNENANHSFASELAKLQELTESLASKFADASQSYIHSITSIGKQFLDSVASQDKLACDVLDKQFHTFEQELNNFRERIPFWLQSTKESLLAGLSARISVLELNLARARSNALCQTVIPKLNEGQNTLRTLALELQEKLIGDLDNSINLKLSEFKSQISEQKEDLQNMLDESTNKKQEIQEKFQLECSNTMLQLTSFVEHNLNEARLLRRRTAEQIADIDIAIHSLADLSNVELNTDFVQTKNSLLEKLGKISAQTSQDMQAEFKANIVALEETGKSSQEELISTMEEEAHLVRKTSEQALSLIRTTIADSFTAIQSAQDNYISNQETL